MILEPTKAYAARNLIETYFTLAAGTRGATLWQEDGFRVCLGSFEHPICNFAADLRLSSQSRDRLRSIALRQPSFSVYSLSTDEPADVSHLLESSGFRLGHRLKQMGTPATSVDPSLPLMEADGRRERLVVARFMAEQFFGAQPAIFRRRVIETTAAAVDLPLFSYGEGGRIFAAAMASLDTNSFGIYNLCVAPAARGKGLGTELLRSLTGSYLARGRYVVLQCEESLTDWYRNRGFEPDGDVAIYNMPKRRTVAIMESN